MTNHPESLLRSLLKSMLLPSFVAIVLCGTLAFLLVKDEYDEALDIGLTNRAYLLLGLLEGSTIDPAPSTSPSISNLLNFEEQTHRPEERTLFWLLDADGAVLQVSPLATAGLYPDDFQGGFTTANSYRFRYLQSPAGSGKAIIVGEPLIERNEAVRDILILVMLSFFALVVVMCLAMFRSLRVSVQSVRRLSEKIAEKSERDLTPIDRRHSFQEIEPAIDTLDELMGRLNTALIAEREFATVAAHELRTPVAICLAHTQRLKATLIDAADKEKATAIEKGLKRLTKLIERLLQLSRAQSGLGANAESSDLNKVTQLLLAEFIDRLPEGKKVETRPPMGSYQSYISPDAFGIILNNLFDNASKYCDGPTGIMVDAATSGEIVVSNDCDPLSVEEMTEIKQRFGRKSNLADGYGLGLSIVQALCEQAGATLEISSPIQGSGRGFTATLKLP
ncbi:MAG: histidine kinase dimerization/phospho-acceptor domain-containing protein [Sulfitobacter sp.]